MIFQRKLETSPVNLCGIQSPGHDDWAIPSKNTLQSQRKQEFTHQKTQTKSLLGIVSSGIWQESNLLVYILVLYLHSQILPASHLKILFCWGFFQARLRPFNLLQWHFSRVPSRIWKTVRTFSVLHYEHTWSECSSRTTYTCAQAAAVCHRRDIFAAI